MDRLNDMIRSLPAATWLPAHATALALSKMRALEGTFTPPTLEAWKRNADLKSFLLNLIAAGVILTAAQWALFLLLI